MTDETPPVDLNKEREAMKVQEENGFDAFLRIAGYKDRKHFFRDLIFDIILLAVIAVFANEALNRWELCAVPTETFLNNTSIDFDLP